jgi:hypothetical protein
LSMDCTVMVLSPHIGLANGLSRQGLSKGRAK